MGTMLADFVHISGVDGPVPPAGVNQVAISKKFDTGGIRTERSAILMFSVMPVANPPQPAVADVFINDVKVGSILNPVFNTFTMQTIVIAIASTAHFNAGSGALNEFAIKNVPRAFQIKDIVCFFHQES
jgi:hypothetical protein